MNILAVKIKYKNWRGEVAYRNIQPIEIIFGSNEFHKDPQWLMKAMDLDKNVERTFAIADIMEWIK